MKAIKKLKIENQSLRHELNNVEIRLMDFINTVKYELIETIDKQIKQLIPAIEINEKFTKEKTYADKNGTYAETTNNTNQINTESEGTSLSESSYDSLETNVDTRAYELADKIMKATGEYWGNNGPDDFDEQEFDIIVKIIQTFLNEKVIDTTSTETDDPINDKDTDETMTTLSEVDALIEKIKENLGWKTDDGVCVHHQQLDGYTSIGFLSVHTQNSIMINIRPVIEKLIGERDSWQEDARRRACNEIYWMNRLKTMEEDRDEWKACAKLRLNRAEKSESHLAESIETMKKVYAKHWLGDESIGWDELGNQLQATLCNVIGDDAYSEFINRKEKLSK